MEFNFGYSYGEFFGWLMRQAREDGAITPCVVDSTSREPIVLDTNSGRTWKIRLEEF